MTIQKKNRFIFPATPWQSTTATRPAAVAKPIAVSATTSAEPDDERNIEQRGSALYAAADPASSCRSADASAAGSSDQPAAVHGPSTSHSADWTSTGGSATTSDSADAPNPDAAPAVAAAKWAVPPTGGSARTSRRTGTPSGTTSQSAPPAAEHADSAASDDAQISTGSFFGSFREIFGNSNALQLRDWPIRCVIEGKYQPVIVGPNGSTIKEIAHTCRCRVEFVNLSKRERQVLGNNDRVLTVHGNAEQASKAVARILEVIQVEALKDDENVLVLVYLK